MLTSPRTIDGLEFTTETDYGVIINTPGIYSFVRIEFTGAHSNVLNNSGGAVTIGVTSGALPTITNSVGSSTTIEAVVQVTLTNLIPDTEVRVYKDNYGLELAGTESSTSLFSFTASPGEIVDIMIVNLLYEIIRLENFTVPLDNTIIQINQIKDRNYI